MRPKEKLTHEQVEAIAFGCEGADVLLLADVGYGKTAIGLTIIQQRIDAGLVRRGIIFAPKRVARSIWSYERDQWEHTQHIRIAVAAGESARKRREAIESDAHIVTLNYENIPWFVDNFARNGKRPPFDFVVFDEVDKMKTPGSKRFKKLRPIVDWWKMRMGMTGTPTPNRLHEIWAQAFLTDGGEALDTSVDRFRKKFFYAADHMGYDLQPHIGAEEEVYSAIAPFTYRLGGKGNPGKVHEVDRLVDMSPKQRVAYDEMEKKLIALLDDIDDPVVAKSAAACSNKLLQIASGFSYYERDEAPGVRETARIASVKLDALADLVSELQGQQILVVYAYTEQRDAVLKRFPQARALLDGKAGDTQIEAWNRGEGEMLVFHPASAGHGLNMHLGGCHHLVFLSMPWSSGLYGQVCGRVDRRGQEFEVFIHRIMASESIDERVAEVVRNKQGGERALLEAMKRYTDARRAA